MPFKLVGNSNILPPQGFVPRGFLQCQLQLAGALTQAATLEILCSVENVASVLLDEPLLGVLGRDTLELAVLVGASAAR